MGLFDRFSDTIFLKEDSELEKEIAELKLLKDKVKEKDKIDLDIKKCELGLYGEKQIEYELKSSDLGMYVLHDITIPYEDLTAQIDYIICAPSGMYIVECKNLIGNVTVDNKGEFVREYEINGRKIKESIYSPYRQAQRHIELIKKRWLKKANKFEILLKEKYFNSWYKPLVVFSNPKGILNISKAPKEVKNHIIKIDQINEYFKNEKKKLNWEDLYSQKQMLSNANSWLEVNIERKRDLSSRYTLNSINTNVRKVDVSYLEERLKTYRTEKSKAKNVPAYYIFNNDEMAKLIEIKPKNVEELKKAKILDVVKIKLHGEEIIDILNKE